MHMPNAETIAKMEVLADLESDVDELMVALESKRILWFPSEVLAPPSLRMRVSTEHAVAARQYQ